MRQDGRRSLRLPVWAMVALGLALLAVAVPAARAGLLVREDLLGISFVGDRGWASGRWGTILNTADGGRTWTRQETGTDYTLAAIHFIDQHHGWAVGDEGIILHTDDGGQTWTRQASPVRFFLMDVYFADARTGWAVGEQTHILHTADGGATWTVIFADGDFILKALSFGDRQHGWAVGEFGYIYYTADGGRSWAKQAGHYGLSEETGEIEGGTYLFDVHALDSRQAWAVGIDGHVIRTEDGGATWRTVATGAPKTQLFAVVADGEGRVAIGGNGVLIDSPDGGRTWRRPALDRPVTYGWIYRFARRSEGFAAVGWEGALYLGGGNEPWKRVAYE